MSSSSTLIRHHALAAALVSTWTRTHRAAPCKHTAARDTIDLGPVHHDIMHEPHHGSIHDHATNHSTTDSLPLTLPLHCTSTTSSRGHHAMPCYYACAPTSTKLGPTQVVAMPLLRAMVVTSCGHAEHRPSLLHATGGPPTLKLPPFPSLPMSCVLDRLLCCYSPLL